MLPNAKAFFPAAFRTSAIKVVTVVLQLVPVVAITSAGQDLQANSISLITGILNSLAQSKARDLEWTPGLTTAKSCPRIKSAVCLPISTAMPLLLKSSALSLKAGLSALSVTETIAPKSLSKLAAHIPLLARPITMTFLPAHIDILAYL